MRALAGLWPWGEGDIEMRAGAKLFLLPQRAYVPIGTLRRAANYPDAAHSRSVEEIAKVLKKVGLGHLVEHLDEERPWDQTLSGGEKQRLAFARIFLHRPDIIVLDEATAALDSQSEDQLMELLSQEFKEATVVSVGHRSELEAFHGRKIVLQRGRRGAKLVSDVYRIPKPVLPIGRSRMGLLSPWIPALRIERSDRVTPPFCTQARPRADGEINDGSAHAQLEAIRGGDRRGLAPGV